MYDCNTHSPYLVSTQASTQARKHARKRRKLTTYSRKWLTRKTLLLLCRAVYHTKISDPNPNPINHCVGSVLFVSYTTAISQFREYLESGKLYVPVWYILKQAPTQASKHNKNKCGRAHRRAAPSSLSAWRLLCQNRHGLLALLAVHSCIQFLETNYL